MMRPRCCFFLSFFLFSLSLSLSLSLRGLFLCVSFRQLKKMGRLARKGEAEKIELRPELPDDSTREQKAAVAHMFARTPDVDAIALRMKKFISILVRCAAWRLLFVGKKRWWWWW